MNRRALGYGLTTVLFWSTVASAFKIALEALSPLELLVIASATSTAALAAILARQHRLKAAIVAPGWAKSILLGFINPFLYYMVLFKAYSLLPGQEAQALNYTWPIVVAILSVPVLGERLSFRRCIGILISFLGVLIIGTRGNLLSLEFHDPLGCLLAVSSSLVWATFWLVNIRDRRDPVLKLFRSFLVGSLLSAGLLAATGGAFQSSAPRSLLAAGYAGLFEMSLAFVIWMKALDSAKSKAAVGQLVYLSPFLSLVFLRLVVGEPILPSSLAGLSFIVLGILASSRRMEGNRPSATREQAV